MQNTIFLHIISIINFNNYAYNMREVASWKIKLVMTTKKTSLDLHYL